MKKAFTLIELLVTVVILGILISVGIFTYQGITETAKETHAFKILKV